MRGNAQKTGLGKLWGVDAKPGVEAALVAGVLALVVVVTGMRGADYPAQYFRAAIFDADGFTIWNNAWYSGHFTPSYSLITPPLSAWFGPVAVTVVSSIVSAFLFGRLAKLAPGSLARFAALVFAVSTVANVLVGRTAFALGLAFGLWSLDAWFRERQKQAVALAIVAGFATPVASVFLGVIAGAIALNEALPGERRFRPQAWSSIYFVASLTPLAAFSILFGSSGIFKFEPVAFALSVVGAIGLAWCTSNRVVWFAAAAGLAGSIAFFTIENPMGGNFQRFPMFFAGTAALLFTTRKRNRLAVGLAVAFACWTIFPAAESSIDAYADPSREEAYFTPLVNFINWHGDTNSRVEIPFTLNHWESNYVATEFSLARGWERQSDREVNPMFYSELSAADYHDWLLERAVRWVALPDVALDNGGKLEAELLAREHDWLTVVWEDEHWTVWEVSDATKILSEPAELVYLGYDNILLRSAEVGTATLRIRFMPYWTVEGPATINSTEDGLTEINFLHPGQVKLSARLEFGDLGSSS